MIDVYRSREGTAHTTISAPNSHSVSCSFEAAGGGGGSVSGEGVNDTTDEG